MHSLGSVNNSSGYPDFEQQAGAPNGAHEQMALSHQQLLALLPKILAQQKPDVQMMMQGMPQMHGGYMQPGMLGGAPAHPYPQQHVQHQHQPNVSPASHDHQQQAQAMLQGNPPNLFSQINQAMAKYQMQPQGMQQGMGGLHGQANGWAPPQHMLQGMPQAMPATSQGVPQGHSATAAAPHSSSGHGSSHQRRHSEEGSKSSASLITVGGSSIHSSHSKSKSSSRPSAPRAKLPVSLPSDDDEGGDSDDEGSRGPLSKDDRKEARREYHKRIERKRRDRMKSLYDTLRELANPQEPADKNTVLQGAVNLIKDLQRENAILLASTKRHSTINSSGCSNSSNGGEGSEKRDTPGDVSDNSLDSEESGNSNANSSSTNDSCGAKSTSTGSTGSSSREVSTEAIARKPNGDHALTKSNIKRASGMPSKGLGSRSLSDREGSEGSSEDREREKRPPTKRAKNHHAAEHHSNGVSQVHEAINQEA